MEKLYFLMLMFMLVACRGEEPVLGKMEEIKSLGNAEPKAAMQMLDSIGNDIQNASEYAQRKFELLKVRLADKADIIPTTDSVVLSLISYFESHGTIKDKQEVYYYTGSVYRDLHDTPRALENFLTSLKYAGEGECDSLMVRNTYSNLHYLYYNVQDYESALQMAAEELAVAEKLNIPDEYALMHNGAALIHLRRHEEAKPFVDKTLALSLKKNPKQIYTNIVVLLTNFSYLKDMEKAGQCYKFIQENYDKERALRDPAFCLAAGQFFKETGQLDSAQYYYKQILDKGMGLLSVYDASRHSFFIDKERGDLASAVKSAEKFILASDTLNLGERQKMAATVNNQYKYYKNEEAERRIRVENERKSKLIMLLSFASVLILLLATLIYYYMRQRQFKSLLEKTEELRDLKQTVAQKENEIDDVNAKLNYYNEVLAAKEKELGDKIQQNLSLLSMMHQKELEGSAADVIETVRKAAVGQHAMSPMDWEALFSAVDEIYPDFKDSIAQKAGLITEKQLKVCYLMRIGLSNAQIENLTDIPTVTVWRYTTRFGKILNIPARPTRQPKRKKNGGRGDK